MGRGRIGAHTVCAVQQKQRKKTDWSMESYVGGRPNLALHVRTMATTFAAGPSQRDPSGWIYCMYARLITWEYVCPSYRNPVNYANVNRDSDTLTPGISLMPTVTVFEHNYAREHMHGRACMPACSRAVAG